MKETHLSNYQNKLEGLRTYVREDPEGNCIDILKNQVQEILSKLSGLENSEKEDLADVFIRTLSKDLSRFSDSFGRYQRTLSEMNSSNLSYLRKKIVSGDKNFFKETWKEDSDDFFQTRKFIHTYVKDQKLSFKINSTIDCITSSLHRYTLSKYGK